MVVCIDYLIWLLSKIVSASKITMGPKENLIKLPSTSFRSTVFENHHKKSHLNFHAKTITVCVCITIS